MAIEKKLIHFGKLADFEIQLNAGNILDRSIVFIQDAKKIWTHGTYYDCSESGASEGTSNYYITEFTYYDFYNAASENGQLQISANDATGLIDSIERGSRILIPYGDGISGYAIMLGENDGGEVYIAVYSPYYVITALFFENDIRQGNNLTFDNDVTISNAIVYKADTASRTFTLAVRDSSGEINANGIRDDQGNWWVTPTSSNESRASADYQFQSKIQDLDEIREGASKGATAHQGLGLLATVATSGSYNDLSNKPTIPSAVTESTVSGWGFTKNTGTYSKPSGGIPKSDLASAVQTSLGKADTALQSYTEQYKGTVTGVKMNGASKGSSGVVDLGNVVTGVKINGSTKSPSSGVVDLGTVITSHQDISGKQDKLVSGTNIKTINGESILGNGDVTISGGSIDTSNLATKDELATKQDIISDIDTIRSNAANYKGTVTSVKIDNVSKSPSSGVVNLGYINKQLSTYSSSSMTLSPNIYYRNTSTSLSTLTITLGSVSNSNIINEYFVEFTTRSAGTTVSLPSTIKWANGEAPTFEASTTYQISIVNNLGVVTKFK